MSSVPFAAVVETVVVRDTDVMRLGTVKVVGAVEYADSVEAGAEVVVCLWETVVDTVV